MPYVVLGEARSTIAGGEAKLARDFVSKGIPFVLTMPYKPTTSGIEVFTTNFYKALLFEGKPFPAAVSTARTAMRENKTRTSKLGLPILLEDWIVPVTYVSHDFVDPQRVCHYRYYHHYRERPIPDAVKQSTRWDTQLLNIETRLLDPWDCGAGPVVNLYGFAGIGKTTFLEQGLRWWTKTGMVQKAVYFSFRQSGFVEPTSILPQLARALRSRELNPIHIVSSIEPNPFPNLEGPLDAIYDWLAAEDADPRFLLVLDDFPTCQSPTNYSPLTVEQKTAWIGFLHGDFARFRKQGLVIVASGSKLDWLSPWTRPDAVDNGDDSPTSPFYDMPGSTSFLSQVKGAEPAFWAPVDNPEDLQLLENLVEYFGYLPPLVEQYVAQPLRDFHTSFNDAMENLKALSENFLRGRRLPEPPAHEDHFLPVPPISQLCTMYFDSQPPIEKAILLSLSKFVGYLGGELPNYWLNYIQCLRTDVARCLPREYQSHNRLHWIPHKHKLKHWILALEGESIEEIALMERGNTVLEDLCRLGLLKKTFVFFKLIEGRYLSKEPVYQIHPFLTIFLQGKALTDVPLPDSCAPQDSWTFPARTKTAFLTFLRHRVESWDGASSPFATESESSEFFQGLNSKIEEGLLRNSVLAGLHMWLEPDTDHRDISFPKAVFKYYLAPWPALTRDIEPSAIADLVKRIRPVLEADFTSEYVEARERQQHAFSRAQAKKHRRMSLQTDDPKVKEELTKAHEELVTSLISLREELQLGTWLVWYDVLRGRSKSALEQVEQNGEVLDRLPQPKFSEIAGYVPGLMQAMRRTELVAGFLTKKSHLALSQLDQDGWNFDGLLQSLIGLLGQPGDPVAQRFAAIAPRILREALGSGLSGITWRIRTREEGEELQAEQMALMRDAFNELLSIPLDWYQSQMNIFPRAVSEVAAHFGLSLEHMGPSWGTLLDFISSLPNEISAPLRKTGSLLSAAKADITAGRPSTAVFDAYYKDFSGQLTTACRNALVFCLDYATATNQLVEQTAYHHALVATAFHHNNWPALDRLLAPSPSHSDPRAGEPAWEFLRGASALRHQRWSEAATRLQRALHVTYNLTPAQLSAFAPLGAASVAAVRVLILRHLIAYKYAVPAAQDPPAASPRAWALFLQAWVLGYARRGGVYAQNGALLEMFAEYYFAPGIEPRRVERALEAPPEDEFGHAMMWYEGLRPSVRAAGGGDAEDELARQQVEAHVLIEFVRRAVERGDLFGDDVEATVMKAETFMRSWELQHRGTGVDGAYSVALFRELGERIVGREEGRRAVFEEVERRLFRREDGGEEDGG